MARMDSDLEALLAADTWRKPAARDLTLWLVTLTAPARVWCRPAWMLQVAYAALRRQRKVPRG